MRHTLRHTHTLRDIYIQRETHSHTEGEISILRKKITHCWPAHFLVNVTLKTHTHTHTHTHTQMHSCVQRPPNTDIRTTVPLSIT